MISPEILEHIKNGWYVVMFILMVIEWPLITLAGAALASVGIFDIFIVAILGWIGDMVWDVLFFSIGRYGLKIFQKKTEIDTCEEKNFIAKLDKIIEKNLLLAIFIIKFVPYAPPIGFPYIGRSKIPLKKFLKNSLISCIPIPLFIAIIGFNIGKITNFWENSSHLEKTGIILLITLILLCIWFVFQFIKKKITQKLGNETLISCETKNEKTEKIDE